MSNWDTTSGLASDYEGSVTEAWFEEGDYGATLKLAIDSPAFDSPVTNFYPCGKGVEFVSEDEVSLTNMKDNRFNTNSAVGQLIEALKASESLLAQVGSDGPQFAKSFLGLTAKWEVKEMSFTDKGGTKRNYSRTYPQAIEGKADDTKVPPAWLVKIANENSNYEDFVTSALEELGRQDVKGQEAVEVKRTILDSDFWSF
jgi:hypothetical protein